MSMKSRFMGIAAILAMFADLKIGKGGLEKSRTDYSPEYIKSLRNNQGENHIRLLLKRGCKFFYVPTDSGNVEILALNEKNAYRKAGVITRKEMKRFNYYSFKPSLS